MKNNSITLIFYNSLVIKTIYQNTAVFQGCFSFSLTPPLGNIHIKESKKKTGSAFSFELRIKFVRSHDLLLLIPKYYFAEIWSKGFEILTPFLSRCSFYWLQHFFSTFGYLFELRFTHLKGKVSSFMNNIKVLLFSRLNLGFNLNDFSFFIVNFVYLELLFFILQIFVFILFKNK